MMTLILEFIKSRKGMSTLIVAVFIFAVFLIFSFFILFGGSNNTETDETTPETTGDIYKPGSLEKEIERLSQRRILSENDRRAKEHLLKLLDGNSGILYETSSYRIEYVKSLDDIEIEILTPNIEEAKKEALSWLSEIPGSSGLGLSNAGICSFPVSFYLNFDLKTSLPEETVFDPTPPGC